MDGRRGWGVSDLGGWLVGELDDGADTLLLRCKVGVRKLAGLGAEKQEDADQRGDSCEDGHRDDRRGRAVGQVHESGRSDDHEQEDDAPGMKLERSDLQSGVPGEAVGIAPVACGANAEEGEDHGQRDEADHLDDLVTDPDRQVDEEQEEWHEDEEAYVCAEVRFFGNLAVRMGMQHLVRLVVQRIRIHDHYRAPFKGRVYATSPKDS